jgi:Zn-dependent protease with chaperone function
LKAVARKAELPVPQIALVDDAPDVNVVTYGMNPQAAKVVITGAFMEHVRPNDDELDAELAHELSHIRHGDFVTSTLLRFPIWLLHKILYVLQVVRWLGTQCFAMFAQIAGAFGLIGLFMILGAMLLLVYLSITAAIVGAAIFVCTLALSAFEREREYLADMYSARLLGSPKPLQSVLAKLEQASERVRAELEKRAKAAEEGEEIDVNVKAPEEAFTSEAFVAKSLQNPPDVWQAFMRGEFFMSHPVTEHRIFYLENPLKRVRFFSNLWNKFAAKASARLKDAASHPPSLKVVLIVAFTVGASLAALPRLQHWIIYAIAPAIAIAGAAFLGYGARREKWSGEHFVSGVVLTSYLSATVMFVLGIMLWSPFAFYFPAVFVATLPINWIVGLLVAQRAGA